MMSLLSGKLRYFRSFNLLKKRRVLALFLVLLFALSFLVPSDLDIRADEADSLTIPDTDGQLTTIWLCGDLTVGNLDESRDDGICGWGQFFSNYVDKNTYDVRTISASGVTSSELKDNLFSTVESYGKSGDILILAVGVNDYIKGESSDTYISSTTDMIRSAKARGMSVYLVKQHGEEYEIHKYPLPTKKWFSDEIDEMAESEDVGVIDLYRPWIELNLHNYYFEQEDYYTEDEFHLNANGSDRMAQMVSEQLFPKEEPLVSGGTEYIPGSKLTAKYETEVSGEAIANPHKGFVMTAYTPYMISSGYEYGIGGSKNNQAWNVVTIVSGSPKWCDLNPEEDVYNWSEIDAMLEACEENGLTYEIRIMPYSSYLGKDYVPQWVYDKGAKKNVGEVRNKAPETVEFPMWDDPIYIEAHKKFVTALAEKYDGDPRVELIDVRPFGDYGEWHNSFVEDGDSYMPSLDVQKDMLNYYAAAFDETLLALPSNARGAIYQYALSLGITKRDDGLISLANAEWSLIPTYEANMPVVGENYWPYQWMRDTVQETEYSLIQWTPDRFRETIEISHLSIFALDQDSNCSYTFYQEQKDVIDEMCNRLGYNFTVTSAELYGKELVVKIKNTGLASCFFDIDLCAEVTDSQGNKIENFGDPIRIESASFHDEMEKTYVFKYDGTLPSDGTLCLAMYESSKNDGTSNPTVRFDNKNNLANKRLKLGTIPEAEAVTGEEPATGEIPQATKGTISFDLGGGTLNGESTFTIEAEIGDTITIPTEIPVREGYVFTYWKGSEYYPGDKYVVTGDHTLTAQWKVATKVETTTEAPQNTETATEAPQSNEITAETQQSNQITTEAQKSNEVTTEAQQSNQTTTEVQKSTEATTEAAQNGQTSTVTTEVNNPDNSKNKTSSQVPSTKDNTKPRVWIILMVLSAYAYTRVKRFKRSYKETYWK